MIAPRQSHTLRNRIFFSFLAALLPVVVFCIAAIEIYLVPAISANARQELHNATLMLKSAVQTAADVAVRNHLKAIAEKNAEIVSHLLNRVASGELDLDEAKIRAREILLAQRIGSSGYIYCLDSHGMAVVHPNPEVENTDNTRFAFVREQMARKQGYIEYEWQNPGEEGARAKALYMVYVTGIDWIISVSSYRAEFIELINISDFKNLVLSPRFGASGYAYVVNQQGDTLIHPLLSDYNALHQSDLSATFLRTMIDSGSGTIEYSWRNPGESEVSDKIAVYESIAEYGWVIVSSSYKSEIFGPASTARKVAYGATLLLCLAVALASYLLSGRLTRPVTAMIAQLDRNTRQLRHEPLPVHGDDELGRLACEFNNFLATIEANNVELQRQKDRYLGLFETSPDALILLRGDVLIDCNPATLLIFSGAKEEIIGKTVVDLSPHEQHGGRSSVDLAVQLIGGAKSGGLQTFEWQHRALDGRLFDAEVQLKRFGEDVGEALLVAFIHDITERKQAEEEREKLQGQLNQAQKMESVGRLAGGVAHDFNNMLGVILGHTEMALTQIDPAAPLYSSLQAVQQAAQRSAALTRQLLAFARKQTVAPKIIDINHTVEGMLNMLGRLIGEDIDLLWQPGINLRPVKVDPSQIDQLLANLCVNARDAIAGVGKITIETDAKTFDETYCADHLGFHPGEYVLLEVSDDGCGMDKKTLNQIFEPFFTTKAQGQGTGLGLASVFGMVKQNNGFINVYSEPGQGTTFKIYLPPYAIQSDGVMEKAPDLPTEHGNETILLVEDEPAILKMTTMMLERLGYTVVAAASPGVAIRLAHEYRGWIDLLMTDVVMPEMNGRQLAENLLSHYPDLKRLFMSGYTANVIAHHGVLDEDVHFIQKPFSMKDLGGKLREALESSHVH